mmetsp:Transcript_18027/g.17349  ORF Transcript_18027/g.17349 Transcript_18027/m.17349 type:complete len:320 (-) Transcript_18027:613-1572(-)|eukprot:CAMPEP_0119034456 /NCGR_PEP_ID=MMETSP1177-20130426/1443_1 /TAXON_ID=2985 /ORGANISM="Ochromonas sp, Strain CCMP1899" /LENGTH=319 /DNA_ID=CAMNT_0006991901 /DNA_START=101 /DNA_END=1060 /DNA_ORIENTATION=+
MFDLDFTKIFTKVCVFVTFYLGYVLAVQYFFKKEKKEKGDTSTSYKTIDVTLDKNVLVITLDRPKKKNAFSKLMYKELERALRAASENEAVGIILLTGNGDYYSSGNDLSNFSEIKHPLTIAKEARDLLHGFTDSFITCQKPIIVAVNGPAIGIAVTTLGLCDKVFSSDKASYRTPFAALGQSPEGCSTFMFPKIMGEEIARKVLGEGLVLSSEEALKCGLVHCIVPDAKIKEVVLKYCHLIASLDITDSERIKTVAKENLKEKLIEVNFNECEELQKCVVSKKCFTALIAYLESRNMRIAGLMLRLANFTGFLWGQPK